MSDEAGGRQDPLLDVPAFGRRLRTAGGVLAVLALIGAGVDGLVNGLAFHGMLRWASLFLVAVLAVGAALAALDAYRGADRAQRRGQRLSSGDVGFLPPSRQKD